MGIYIKVLQKYQGGGGVDGKESVTIKVVNKVETE
jgi:hypothetical protein